jgi:hypothetical protein
VPTERTVTFPSNATPPSTIVPQGNPLPSTFRPRNPYLKPPRSTQPSTLLPCSVTATTPFPIRPHGTSHLKWAL